MERALRLGIAVALALLAAQCAKRPIYAKVQGAPFNAQQFEIDKSVCLGEVAKADNGSIQSPTDDDAVFSGCMAQRGYLRQR